MKNLVQSVAVLFLYTCATLAYAEPPIWDPVFGAELPALTGCDDCDTETDSVPAMPVLLGFDFPFAGGFYNSISVNNNGGVALGNDNIVAGDPYVDFDIWNKFFFESDFSDVGNPSILVFNTDLSNDCCGDVGRVYFKTDGTTTATVTWVDAGTALDGDPLDTPFATFQLIMESDGTMTFGYNGIGIGKDMIDNLSQGIVVGVSDGTGALPPGSSNLNADLDSGTNPTVYEIWCYDVSPNASCYEPDQPTNAAFDLDQSNLVFTPNGTGGFTITESTAGTDPTVNVLGVWDATLTRSNCPGIVTSATITFYSLPGDNSILGYSTTIGEDIDPNNCSIRQVNVTDTEIEGFPSSLDKETFLLAGGGGVDDEIILFTTNEIRVDIAHHNGSIGHLTMKRSGVGVGVGGGGGGGGGGCSLGNNQAFDPALLLLAMLSAVYLVRRRLVRST